VPRGYPQDHPAAGWLRYQSFTLGRQLTDAQVIPQIAAVTGPSVRRRVSPSLDKT
jgi:hypothetical protein